MTWWTQNWWMDWFLGFMIPCCILGIPLWRRDRNLVITIAPITACIAFTINLLAVSVPLWRLTPYIGVGTLPMLPYDLGFYPLCGCVLIHLITRKNMLPMLAILLLTTSTTIAEWMYVLANKVVYFHGWTITHTFISYLIAYMLVYGYYRVISRYAK